MSVATCSEFVLPVSYSAWLDFWIMVGMGLQRQSNPLLPAFILIAFLGLLVFLFVTRKHEASQPQTRTQNGR